MAPSPEMAPSGAKNSDSSRASSAATCAPPPRAPHCSAPRALRAAASGARGEAGRGGARRGEAGRGLAVALRHVERGLGPLEPFLVQCRGGVRGRARGAERQDCECAKMVRGVGGPRRERAGQRAHRRARVRVLAAQRTGARGRAPRGRARERRERGPQAQEQVRDELRPAARP
jgi:hypothetical protein